MKFLPHVQKFKGEAQGLKTSPIDTAWHFVALNAYWCKSELHGQCPENIYMAYTELIYVSTLLGESEHELKAILESSVKHNSLNGITGMLLYYRGGFMQVLEGSECEVMETYARICSDKRHHHVTTLTITEVPHRHFNKWTMGYKQIGAIEIEKFPQYAPVFDFSAQVNVINATPGLALEMLMLFSNDMAQ
jgi:hypothetical protein